MMTPAHACDGLRGHTTLGRDHTTLAQCTVQQLEVRFLEERLGRPFWIAGVGDDDVELVLPVREEFEAVADMYLDRWVLEAD